MRLTTILILGAAVYRVFRLLAYDTILKRPRLRLFKRWPRIGEPVQCAWCFGWWLSVIAFSLYLFWPKPTLWVASLLAISTVVGLIDKAD